MVSKLLNFHNRSTEPSNNESTHGLKQSSNQAIKQDDKSFISINIL